MSLRETILEKLQWRYAVQKFDPTKKIANADWKVLEESLRLAPSSYGLQPWKYLIVQTPALREKLCAAAWNQAQIKDCSHLVVFLFRAKMDEEFIQKYLDSIVKIRGVSLESLARLKKNMMGDLVHGPRAEVIQHWSQRQTYIGMGMLMETAALLGIDTCPMEGLNAKEFDQILSLIGTGWHTVAAVPCGYRHPDDPALSKKKVRFGADEIFEYL